MKALRLAPFHYPHLIAGAAVAAKAALASSLVLGALALSLAGAALAGLVMGSVAVALGALALRDARALGRLCRLARARRRVVSQLRLLLEDGWRLRSRPRLPGVGPIAHFVISPDDGLAFALEVGEASSEAGLDRIQGAASCLALAGRPCIAVLAVARLEADQVDERGVLVAGADRVGDVLSEAYRGYVDALGGGADVGG